jgi:hypothetical protein
MTKEISPYRRECLLVVMGKIIVKSLPIHPRSMRQAIWKNQCTAKAGATTCHTVPTHFVSLAA